MSEQAKSHVDPLFLEKILLAIIEANPAPKSNQQRLDAALKVLVGRKSRLSADRFYSDAVNAAQGQRLLHQIRSEYPILISGILALRRKSLARITKEHFGDNSLTGKRQRAIKERLPTAKHNPSTAARLRAEELRRVVLRSLNEQGIATSEFQLRDRNKT